MPTILEKIAEIEAEVSLFIPSNITEIQSKQYLPVWLPRWPALSETRQQSLTLEY